MSKNGSVRLACGLALYAIGEGNNTDIVNYLKDERLIEYSHRVVKKNHLKYDTFGRLLSCRVLVHPYSENELKNVPHKYIAVELRKGAEFEPIPDTKPRRYRINIKLLMKYAYTFCEQTQREALDFIKSVNDSRVNGKRLRPAQKEKIVPKHLRIDRPPDGQVRGILNPSEESDDGESSSISEDPIVKVPQNIPETSEEAFFSDETNFEEESSKDLTEKVSPFIHSSKITKPFNYLEFEIVPISLSKYCINNRFYFLEDVGLKTSRIKNPLSSHIIQNYKKTTIRCLVDDIIDKIDDDPVMSKIMDHINLYVSDISSDDNVKNYLELGQRYEHNMTQERVVDYLEQYLS